MRTKTVMRKIAAVGAGIAMMGATMAGALAANLADYPNMFYKNNKLNAAIVVGDKAVSIDVVGAIDLATSLQYGAREAKTISLGGTETVTASSGVEVKASGNHLTLGEGLSTVENKFNKEDLPVLLADGTVRDKSDNDDYEYDQALYPGAHDPSFGRPDDEVFGDVPLIYLDQSSGVAYTIKVDFDTDINVTALDDSEKITILGKSFTFDPDMDSSSSSLVLYASEKTETLSVGDTKDLTLDDGTVLSIELVGANSDRDTATIRVNGETYSVESGDTVSVAGTSLYINDVFTYNIPTPGAAVEFFVGSDKVEIEESASYADVEVDGDTLEGVQAAIGSGDLEAVDYINFTFTPSSVDLEADQMKYLFDDEELTDPLFKTFKMKFAGVTPALKSEDKTKVSLTRSSDDYKLSFTNRDGEDYTIPLFSDNSGALAYYEDFVGAATNISKDKTFIVNEGNEVTKVYQLVNVDSDNKAKLKDLSDNTNQLYEVGDTVGDSSITISTVHNGAPRDYIVLSAASSLQILTQYKGELNITADPTNESVYDLIFTEGTNNFDDLSTPSVLSVNLTGANSDEDIRIVNVAQSGGASDSADDEDGDVNYGVTAFGTYWEYDKENDGSYLDIYYPEVEQTFHVFYMPVDALTSSVAGGDTLTYYDYNRIEVGLAQLASDISDPTAQNLIVVGGPCANDVAAKLLNLGPNDNCVEGFVQGQAILQLIENGDNVALLVAGMTGADTRRATAVLANYQDYPLSGSEMVVKGTSLQDITVEAPAPVVPSAPTE